MTNLLNGKNAIVYGGGGSIGGAVARTFAAEGAAVFLAGRMRYLAMELGRSNIRVVGIHTAGVRGTLDLDKVRAVNPNVGADPDAIYAGIGQMAMLGRVAELQEVADTAAFLASDRAGAITSQMVNVSCGLIPG